MQKQSEVSIDTSLSTCGQFHLGVLKCGIIRSWGLYHCGHGVQLHLLKSEFLSSTTSRKIFVRRQDLLQCGDRITFFVAVGKHSGEVQSIAPGQRCLLACGR
mmetsp:Transcript_8304/g.29561  ORF Transcript_8304/g.29561 Transcript_8304/m.29561 type:complete len:102 (-) Transcript_8304:133-438(-)